MYGKDIERILGEIHRIHNEVRNQIHLLSRVSDYRLAMIKHTHNVSVNNITPDAPHDHGNGTHIHNFNLQGDSPTNGEGFVNKISNQLTWPEDYLKDEHGSHPHIEDSIIYEEEHPVSAASYVQPIVNIMTNFNTIDISKLEEIDVNNYQAVNNFNNNYGSPWQEIYDLREMVNEMGAYANEYPNLQWIGEKQSLLHLMQRVFTTAVDAKWAIQYYHDWIQRGYDHRFNDNNPSIVVENLDHGVTTGELYQPIKENVNVKKDDGVTPY